MKKQKYLIFLVVLSFVLVNNVFANDGHPEALQQHSLDNQKTMSVSSTPSPTPSILQQEIKKIKTNTTFNSLRGSTSVRTIGTDTLGKTTQGSTTNQTKNKRAEHIKKYLKNIAGRSTL